LRRGLVVSFVATLVVCFGSFAAVLAAHKSPQLGLDLRGGVDIVYCPAATGNAKVCAPPGQVSNAKLNEVVQVLQDRVGGLSVVQPTINVQGPDVDVQLPGHVNAALVEKVLGSTAQLYLRKLICYAPLYTGTTKKPTTSTTTTTTLPAKTGTTTTTTAKSGATTTTSAATTTTTSAAATTTTPSKSGSTTTTTAPATTTTTTTLPPAAKDGFVTPPVCPAQFTPSSTNNPSIYTPLGTYPTTTPQQDTDHQSSYILVPQAGTGQPRVELGPVLANGTIMSGASAEDIATGWVVNFNLTGPGTTIFNKIAAADYHQLVAYDLDGVDETAPILNSSSFPGSGQISGGSITSAQTAGQLALLLKYGALPIPITTLTSGYVSPTLGSASLHAGILAGLLGLFLVMLYTIFYYRALGVVVVLGLTSTAALIYAIISQLHITLDLSGVTGLIVSIGITVDSYVVYFERLKDEVRAGRSIRSSVDKGFRSAYRTILSADAVSLIGALVLWWLSIGAVRGFAEMLGISTILDVFTAYTFTRPLVILLGRNRLFTEAKGLGIARGLGSMTSEAAA